ncbi:MAG: hypothetical protein R3F49_24120 [Planctomycetota bacterium]
METTRTHPTAPDGDAVQEGLGRLRARWTKVHGARLALQVLFYALLTGAAVAFAFPALPVASIVGALLCASLIVGLAGALLTRPTETSLAKEFDDRAGLRDRVSSALDLKHATGGMVEALRQDARAAAARLVPAEVVPLRVPREGYWLPVPIMIFAGAVMLGGAYSAVPDRDPNLDKTLEERIAQLDALISDERGKRESERRRELIEELEKLKAKLRPEETQKKDALEEVAKLREQMEQQRDQDEEKEREIKEKLDELTPGQKDPKLEQAINRGDYAEAMKRLKELEEELKKKLDEKNKELSPEERAELEELLKKLQEIEAKLMKLMQIQLDMAMMGEVLDFLADFDGDLADLEDFDPSKVLKLKDLPPAPP